MITNSSVTKPRLTYFDGPVSRGEECRLALFLAGIDFDDNRLKREEWIKMKPTTPFGSVPFLELPNQPVLAQTNAILTLMGARGGLHPKEDFEAARHLAMMEHVEDLRANVGVTMRMPDGDEKKKARETLASGYLQTWAANAEKQIADDGPFFAGNAINVVDLKILLIMRWLTGGALDHIPANVFASYPKLNRIHNAVEAHPKVKEWTAQTAKKS